MAAKRKREQGHGGLSNTQRRGRKAHRPPFTSSTSGKQNAVDGWSAVQDRGTVERWNFIEENRKGFSGFSKKERSPPCQHSSASRIAPYRAGQAAMSCCRTVRRRPRDWGVQISGRSKDRNVRHISHVIEVPYCETQDRACYTVANRALIIPIASVQLT